MPASIADRLAVRALMENWVLWRDARRWDDFRTLWHKGGHMSATWFQGLFEDFIKTSEDGFKKGVNISHQLGATSVEIKGKRAVVQSKIAIMQRAKVDGILCDVSCFGRFYAFIEKRGARWGIVRLQPIYENDRIDPVDPAVKLKLDAKLLARFPEGYRHLAYLQSKAGFTVKNDLPGRSGPVLQKLYAAADAWLAGKPKAARL
jgi:hypothetical protein